VWGVKSKMLGKCIVLVFLFVGTLWDLKKNMVPKNYLVIWGIQSIIYFSFEIIHGKSVLDIFIGLIPGIVAIVLSVITREQIGMGDGLILLSVGCFQSIKDILSMLFFSFVILTIISIFLLAIRRVGRKSQVPFVPFMLMGQIIVIFGGIS